MKRVYLVTKGSYSDYHIIAAFSDNLVAEVCAKDVSDEWDEGTVEEYEINSTAPRMPLWDISMYRKTGSVISAKDRGKWGVKYDNVVHHGFKGMWNDGKMVSYRDIRARDLEHAVKIANERRVQEIACE